MGCLAIPTLSVKCDVPVTSRLPERSPVKFSIAVPLTNTWSQVMIPLTSTLPFKVDVPLTSRFSFTVKVKIWALARVVGSSFRERSAT